MTEKLTLKQILANNRMSMLMLSEELEIPSPYVSSYHRRERIPHYAADKIEAWAEAHKNIICPFEDKKCTGCGKMRKDSEYQWRIKGVRKHPKCKYCRNGKRQEDREKETARKEALEKNEMNRYITMKW